MKNLIYLAIAILTIPASAADYICRSPAYGCKYLCNDGSGICAPIGNPACPATGQIANMTPWSEFSRGYVAVFDSGFPDMVCQARNGSRNLRGRYQYIPRAKCPNGSYIPGMTYDFCN